MCCAIVLRRKRRCRRSRYGLLTYKLPRATEFIEENLREDLTLTRLSKTLAMSLRHLALAFKTTTDLRSLIMSSSGASSAGLGFLGLDVGVHLKQFVTTDLQCTEGMGTILTRKTKTPYCICSS
jgi:AraC-like DNA-binding protein